MRGALALFLVVLLTGSAWQGLRLWHKHQENPSHQLTREQACEKANQLTKLYYEGVGAEVRLWIKAQGISQTEEIFACLDNFIDPHSKTRIAALNAVVAMKADALPVAEAKKWGMVLRNLVKAQFHSGPELERYLKEADGF